MLRFFCAFLFFAKHFKQTKQIHPKNNQTNTLENKGTEKDEKFSYHSGNEEPKGFGNIGFVVNDLNATCETLIKLGVTFSKKPNEMPPQLKGTCLAHVLLI